MKHAILISIKILTTLCILSLFFSCPDLTYTPSDKQRNWEGNLYDDGSGRYTGSVIMSLNGYWHFDARIDNDDGYTFWWDYYIEGDIDISAKRAYIKGKFPDFYESTGPFSSINEGGEFTGTLNITSNNSDYSSIVAEGSVSVHAEPLGFPDYYYNKPIVLSIHKVSGE